MNIYAFVIGAVLALLVVAGRRSRGAEQNEWFYAALLATFPVYYWVFATYARDYGALAAEVGVGALFIAMAYAAYRYGGRTGWWILAAGYVAHTAYDVVHESLFHNGGTPAWWPEFCGAVDLLLGIYLLYTAITASSSQPTRRRPLDAARPRTPASR